MRTAKRRWASATATVRPVPQSGIVLVQNTSGADRDRFDCVVVYKVDRLSRSLMDFARMIALFDQHEVSFVSVTQHFDTSTAGRRAIAASGGRAARRFF